MIFLMNELFHQQASQFLLKRHSTQSQSNYPNAFLGSSLPLPYCSPAKANQGNSSNPAGNPCISTGEDNILFICINLLQCRQRVKIIPHIRTGIPVKQNKKILQVLTLLRCIRADSVSASISLQKGKSLLVSSLRGNYCSSVILKKRKYFLGGLAKWNSTEKRKQGGISRSPFAKLLLYHAATG